MIALLKGLIAGIIGSVIASLLINRVTSSKGGMLNIHILEISDYHVYWSWPLFILLGAFAAILFKMME